MTASSQTLVERAAEPVTLEQVVAAVLALDRFSEAEILDLISSGRLRDAFPYELRTGRPAADTMNWDEIPEASPRPLTEEEDLASMRGEQLPKDSSR